MRAGKRSMWEVTCHIEKNLFHRKQTVCFFLSNLIRVICCIHKHTPLVQQKCTRNVFFCQTKREKSKHPHGLSQCHKRFSDHFRILSFLFLIFSERKRVLCFLSKIYRQKYTRICHSNKKVSVPYNTHIGYGYCFYISLIVIVILDKKNFL